MHLSQFDIERSRRALSLGYPITSEQMAGILDATQHELEEAVQAAREEEWEKGSSEETEADARAEAAEAARDVAEQRAKELEADIAAMRALPDAVAAEVERLMLRYKSETYALLMQTLNTLLAGKLTKAAVRATFARAFAEHRRIATEAPERIQRAA